MASQTFRAALNSAEFPFMYQKAGRGVLQSGLDVAPRTNQTFYGKAENQENNTLQTTFCTNVLPTSKGYKSIGFNSNLGPPGIGGVTDMQDVFSCFDNTLQSFSVVGMQGATWNLGNPGGWFTSIAVTSPSYVPSAAEFGNRTYLLNPGDTVYEVDNDLFVAHALTLPAGVAMADIIAIGAAGNYLLVATKAKVLWSSLVNQFDFADTVNGAGGQIPLDLVGEIRALRTISGGFVIYSTKNAVGATYTNNAATPFLFRGITNSGGVASPREVGGDGSLTSHYVANTAGFQKINLQGAIPIFEALSDYIREPRYDIWNAGTKQIDQGYILIQANNFPRIKIVNSRYVVILGPGRLPNLTRPLAYLYDLLLERWGKWQFSSVDICPLPNAAAVYPVFVSMYLWGPDGDATAILDDPALIQSASGVVILGRVQVLRGRKVTFQDLEIDGLRKETTIVGFESPTPPTVTLKVSQTGSFIPANVVNYTPTQYVNQQDYAAYRGRVTGQAFDVVIEGGFDLTNVILRTTIHGSR